MKNLDPLIEILSTADIVEDRYTRLRQLGWDRELLQNAYALVVGAGALGNEVLKNLALLGWGHIIIVDMDTIEDSNLARSVLFRKEDVSKKSFKSIIAAQRVKEINPDIQIIPLVGTIQDCVGLGVFRRMDVVFGCLDNRQARIDVSRACWQTLTPYIDGGLDGINGDIHVIVPPITACYGCTISPMERQNLHERHACLKVRVDGSKPVIPTAPTISSIIAGWQTQLAVKHLHGKKIPFGQRLALFGLSDMCERFAISPDSRCQDHSSNSILFDDEIIELAMDVNNTSLKQLSKIIYDDLGMGDNTVISFDFELLINGICPTCGEEKEFFRPLTSVLLSEILCPKCESTFVLNTVQDLKGNEPYSNLTLMQLGVPPMHILTIKNWSERIYKFIQLGVDIRGFFDAQNNHNPKLILVKLLQNNDQEKLVKLPMRIPIRLLVDWLVENGEISIVGESQISNQTQNFIYDIGDSLIERGTREGDCIIISSVNKGTANADDLEIDMTTGEMGL